VEELYIAICEDEQGDAEKLKRLIGRSGVLSRVFLYADAEALLGEFSPGFFHLILLDIYFKDQYGNHIGMTGLEAAEKIRGKDMDCWLAFTTESRDNVHFGYKVKAERYLEKPLIESEVIALVQRAKAHFDLQDQEISFVVERKTRKIKQSDVLYAEIHNRKSVIHMKDETLTVYQTMNELEAKLAFPSFLRCHRSFIVNMDYVEGIDRDFTMQNGDTVQIGRDRQWKVRAAYRGYLVKLARGEPN
jgi:DNA-binding LytR/AlgR family response regulator